MVQDAERMFFDAGRRASFRSRRVPSVSRVAPTLAVLTRMTFRAAAFDVTREARPLAALPG